MIKTYPSKIIHQNIEKLELESRKEVKPIVKEHNQNPSILDMNSKYFSMEFVTK